MSAKSYEEVVVLRFLKEVAHSWTDIVMASTSCAWLGRWKLIIVKERPNRIRAIEAMKDGMRRLG